MLYAYDLICSQLIIKRTFKKKDNLVNSTRREFKVLKVRKKVSIKCIKKTGQ